MLRTIAGKIEKRRHEKGAILVVATFVIVAMLLMATPFLFKMSVQYRSTERGADALTAFNLAEAGVDHGLWEMNTPWIAENPWMTLDIDGNGTLGPATEQVGGFAAQIEGTITTNPGVEPDTRTMIVTGRMPHVGSATVDRTVVVTMEKYYRSIFDFGFFADTQITGETNIQLSSYNSNPLATSGGWMGHAGTNGNIDLSIEIERGSSNEFRGNLTAGVGTNPNELESVISLPSDSAFVENPDTGFAGRRTILQSPFEMPSVDLYNLPPRDLFGTVIDFTDWFVSAPPVSDPLASGFIAEGYNHGAYSIPKNATRTFTAADSGVYTSLNFNNGATLNISGNVALYVTGLDGATGSFSMQNGSKLVIQENSSLTLVLGKTTFTLDNNTFENSSGQTGEGIPANFLILGTDQFTGTLDMKNNVDTYAAIYVPRATVNLVLANLRYYGAVVCNILNMGNNTELYYDEALKNLDNIRGGVPYWRLTSWQEIVGGN